MSENFIRLVRYSDEFKPVWNDFVKSSKNGTFLFDRAYMDYHSDRFKDHSYLIYRKEKLYCLLPANLKDGILYSHQGLTYGGLIMSDKCTAEGILDVFATLISSLKEEGIIKLIYKPVPHIYHTLPSEEDLYALFRHNARLIVRNISSTIRLDHLLKLNKDRSEALRRSIKKDIIARTTKEYDCFWKILEDNLMHTYKAKPVHTLSEIKSLVTNFPQNIVLWGAYKEDKMVAGLVAYYTATTIHAQYISATPDGKKCGAVDLLVNRLVTGPEIREKYWSYDEDDFKEEDPEWEERDMELSWLDLGTSNEDGGRVLNESLIYQKEGFGGRGICYDTYEIII